MLPQMSSWLEVNSSNKCWYVAQIDLEALANWAGTEFICGKVVGMTLPSEHDLVSDKQKLVHVEIPGHNATADIPFDVVSIDIGSTTRDFTTIPGVHKYCISTRPISDLVQQIEAEEARLKEISR